MKAWKTLGAAVHYDAHLAIQLREDPYFPLPEVASTSFMAVGHSGYSTAYEDQLANAIDRRTGRADETPESLEYRRRVDSALPALLEYDPVAYRCVILVCLRGKVELLPGSGLRHEGPMYQEAATLYFDGETRTLQRRIDHGWELLALLLAQPAVREAAIERGKVAVEPLVWARDRRYL